MRTLLSLLLFALCSLTATAQGGNPVSPERWDPEILAMMETLPVQEGGRIKPLSAYAAHMLYLVHGRRDMKLDTDGDGKTDLTLTPTEWLLDVWFQPTVAADFPLFRIENVDVLDAIGVAHEGGQRFDFEYVTYRQLAAAKAEGVQPVDTLWQLAGQYRKKPAETQTPVEAHIIRTNLGVDAYGGLFTMLSQMHAPFDVHGDVAMKTFAGKSTTDFAEVVRRGGELAQIVRQYRNNTSDPALGNSMQLASVLTEVAQRNSSLGLFPPSGGKDAQPTWATLPALVEGVLMGKQDEQQLAALSMLQSAVMATETSVRNAALRSLRNAVVASATMRGEYTKVELENYYLAASWHYQSLHYFLIAIIVVALGWLSPRAKWLWVAGLVATFVPLCMLIADVVLRCVVRGRPPILNLYDTFLFIAAIGVMSALAAEVVTRRRVAISLAPLFGALLVALARAFEVESGEDQMAPLQAVLDTNYYLATHVTSINMGYAAGMFASFLGTAWLLMNAVGFRRKDVAFHKSVVRATYGVTAFGLIFAVFGTIYGGVWANDSWGRFWGWDPKENGALLICIAQVALLHARMSGLVRDLGFCLCAALTGIVVAFSWFHVNLLGIGLHAYGFSSATKVALFNYYYVQAGLTVAGCVGVLWQRSRTLAGAE
ncbi:MAG: cytochrome c biogenesis protein CcsA, partial [Planctomycetota bacterium]